METPESLGEAYHQHQAKADVNYWKGRALKELGRSDEARGHFEASAAEAGDFSEMTVTEHSPLSWFRGQSLRELGREDEASELFESMKAFGESKLQQRAKIDYFATSLPNLLVFDEDLQERRDAESHVMIALAQHGLGETMLAESHLARTLAFTNADFRAAELARLLQAEPVMQSV
jgi:tetratricopeptide (TPR) repeat protein